MKNIEKGIRKLNGKEATKELGAEIANALEPGDIVALMGELGAGKTTLVKYIAEGLDIREKVISPTFTIVKLYESGRLPLAHFDVYRIGGREELWDIGADEIIGGDKYASVIEWADMVAEDLPKDALLVHLSYGDEDDSRIAEII